MGNYLCVKCQKEKTVNLSMVCNTCDKVMFEKAMKSCEENDNISIYTEERLYEYPLFDDDFERVPSIKGNLKSLDEYEQYIDNMDYFIRNKKLIEEDFFFRLEEEIGKEKAEYFCYLISNYWYDSNKREHSKKIKELKYSIDKYLTNNNFVVNHIEENISEGMITSEDIEKILNINNDIFYLYLENWIEKHPLSYEKNTSNIFFLRGINSDKLVKPYKEKDYINSYTLSQSITEQFSDMGNKKNIIISGEYGLFYNRILFFSPCIPKPNKNELLVKLKNLTWNKELRTLTLRDWQYQYNELSNKFNYPEQLEIGIIPHTSEINFQEIEFFGGVIGYKLNDKNLSTVY